MVGYNYMARVEQAIFANIGNVRLTVIIDRGFVTKREDYWEREYVVAWTDDNVDNDRDSGSNRVNIDSNGDHMVHSGHYMLTEVDAKHDAAERAYLSAGRI
jgi:hypothetical protein